jgi:hypothetical protein
MRFFCIFKPAAGADPNQSWTPEAPTPERLATIQKFIEHSIQSGVLLATEGFQPNPTDVRVRYSAGKFSVTDGPFTEAKEVIGGFALLECPSREAAIANAKGFLEVVGGGETEIHQLLDSPNLPLEKTSLGTKR